ETRRSMTLSVIIPLWNDHAALCECLERLERDRDHIQVIIADASEADDSALFAASWGANVVRCPHPSRGSQLNAGAAAATGDVLVFCHAETELQAAHLASIRSAFADPGVAAAAFYKDLAAHYPLLAWADLVVRMW